MELIDKSTLVAEIEGERKHYLDKEEYDFGWNNALDKILSFLDTLETKKVDLEKEVINWWNENYKNLNSDYEFEKYNGHYMINSTIMSFAKHFFELGLKAKGE